MKKELMQELELDTVENMSGKGVGSAAWCAYMDAMCVISNANNYSCGDPCGLWVKYCR